MKRDPFISILIEKLNKLKRDQDVRERLEESLQEFKAFGSRVLNKTKPKHQAIPTKDKATETIRGSKIFPNNVTFHPSTKHPVRQGFEGRTKVKVQTERETKKDNFTIVGYCFAGNPVPYSTKVRGKRITLGHFKTLVNRRGDFRYFFKRYSNEFGTNIVFEELTDDEELLPLWDGKIFALIEEIELYRL